MNHLAAWLAEIHNQLYPSTQLDYSSILHMHDYLKETMEL